MKLMSFVFIPLKLKLDIYFILQNPQTYIYIVNKLNLYLYPLNLIMMVKKLRVF